MKKCEKAENMKKKTNIPTEISTDDMWNCKYPFVQYFLALFGFICCVIGFVLLMPFVVLLYIRSECEKSES